MDRPYNPRVRMDACRRLVVPALVAAFLAIAGCGVSAEQRQVVREVDLAAFSTPPRGATPEVVGAPIADIEPPSTTMVEESTTLGDGSTVTKKKELVSALDPATQRQRTQSIDDGTAQTVRVGQRWPVESLVGQINGRPIFANDFFNSIEDNLLRIVANPNQQQARAQMEQLIRERFMQLVNSELVLAEAESRLSPEMKLGVLAWLRELQETTIAQRGGSRSAAEETLRDETGMTVEQFVETRKNSALADDLLRRKVQPRVIVSWRDVERRYDLNREQYSPDPLYRVGRIRLTKTVQQEKIDQVTKMFAEKKSFAEVAAAVGVPNGGYWTDFRVSNGKMVLKDLTDDVQAALAPLLPGMVSAPVEQRTSITWFSIIGSEVPPSVSIFDPMLQLRLRTQINAERNQVEQQNYLMSLRRRWLSTSIQKMELRLQKMARDRYLDPNKQTMPQ